MINLSSLDNLDTSLREYQNKSKSEIYKAWNNSSSVLFQMPTGTGKTRLFVSIIKDIQRVSSVQKKRIGVLVLAHREELIEQIDQTLSLKYGIAHGIIKAGYEEDDRFPVQVASVQSLNRRLEHWKKKSFDYIIIDEAHHAVSPSYQKLLQQLPDAKVLGVTATPDRGDKKSLAKYFDGIAYEYSLKTAVADGYLCEIKAKTIPLEIDMTNVKISVGDFQVDSVAESLEPYLPQIADAIIREASARKTVVFCPLISIAQELASMIPGAKEVNGTSADRKEILEWFDQAGPGAVLCNAMLLTEGWDCPSCDCVVVLRPTKIRALYCQMIGRGTRLSQGKENLLILDFLWLAGKHNLCKPACLAADNEQDIEAVTKASKDEEIDLFGAVSDAEEARRRALAEALAKQARKKSKLVNPLELFGLLDDIGLADYEPTFKWEEQDATQKQIEVLQRFGVDAD